jgi:HEPN domain-containing protein
MDRLTSMGISNAAKKFLKAAKTLRANNDHLFTPTYFCICQSIELSLKAYLRGSGHTDDQLRKIGHDIEKAVVQAQNINLDFEFSQNDADAIRRINPYYQMKDLQYVKSGYKSLPSIDDLLVLGERLWQSTRQFCIANRTYHEGKGTEVQ